MAVIGQHSDVYSQPNHFSRSLATGFTHFPLALVKADAPIMPLIIRWFESNFGGHISPMRISPWELETITEEWATRVYDKRDVLVQDIVRGMYKAQNYKQSAFRT